MPVGVLLRAIAFMRKRWKLSIVLASVLIAVGWLVFRMHGWTNKYEQLERSHTIELKEIDAARASERAELESTVQRLQSELNESRELYNKQRNELAKRRHETIERIVSEDGGDPERLARKLASSTGLRVKER